MPQSLNSNEIKRYVRQLNLQQFGEAGQLKLKASSVLCVGVGGLGCPASLYLTAAGIGRLGLVDGDCVALSNIHRQILFTESDLGQLKSEVGAKRLSQINPCVDIQHYPQYLDAENAAELFSSYDIIVDCSDNFDTKYLINDACVALKKPFVYASLYQFEGQCAIFNAVDKPCLRCIYPQSPEPGLIANCRENGVLGITAGWFGLIQAMEVLKYIAKIGDTLSGYLLLANPLTLDFHKFKVNKQANCPSCNPSMKPTQPSIKNSNTNHPFNPLTDIHVSELSALLNCVNTVLIDVREPWEYKLSNIGGRNIPLPELANYFQDLRSYHMVAVVCQSGRRSQQAFQVLKKAGFTNVKNVYGGLNGP